VAAAAADNTAGAALKVASPTTTKTMAPIARAMSLYAGQGTSARRITRSVRGMVL